MMKIRTLLLLLFLSSLNISAQKFEGLALTPQMGWNSWNKFGTGINEQMVKEMADALISTGLKDAGYNHILLDDGWMDMERDAQGNLVPHPEKFPNGIKVVADYVHSKGLKFGLYNCAGSKTCAGYPGSRGHEYQDALKYAEWGGRLPEVRLVQHRQVECGGSLHHHARCHLCSRPAHSAEHLRMGNRCSMEMGTICRPQLADYRRYIQLLFMQA